MAVDPSRLAPQPLFADASDDEVAEAAAHFSERHVAAGTHLSNEGGAGYFFFVIESGTADVSHDGEVVATLGPGDFFGEAAVLATTRRTATVTATTEMIVARDVRRRLRGARGEVARRSTRRFARRSASASADRLTA